VAVGGSGTFTTTEPVLCTGSILRVNADVIAAGGSIKVGVVGDGILTLDNAVPVTTNATNALLAWKSEGAHPLERLKGKKIKLVFQVEGAQLYTVLFDSSSTWEGGG
jgi:hypothetical protein